MVSVYYPHTVFHPASGNVRWHDMLDDFKDSKQTLFIEPTSYELQTDGGIIIRGGVPLAGDVFLYLVPRWVWQDML